MISYNKRLIILPLLACLGLVACVATPPLFKESQQKVAAVQQDMHDANHRFARPTVGHSAISAHSITLTKRFASPSWMSRRISIQGNNLPLEFMVSKILVGTGAVSAYEPEVNRTTPISLDYNGTIAGALDNVAARINHGYEVNNNTVTWSTFVSRTFDVSFMPGASQYLLGGVKQQNGTSGSSTEITNLVAGQSNDQFSSLQGALSVWNDLKTTLDTLKSKEGTVIVSESTTTITVRDRPENVRLIAEYLSQMDKSLSRQVALDVQVLEVALNKGFNYGINWNLVRDFTAGRVSIGGAGGATGGGAQMVNLTQLGNGPTAGAGVGFAGSGLWNGTQVFINALSQQGQVSIATQPRVVTLNNQVAEIGINTKTGYLARVTTTFAGNLATPSTSLTPGLVTTGFSLYLLPKIQGNDVYLQISSTLANGLTFKTQSSGSGANEARIQVPTVSEKRFNQRSVVPSGSTLVIAGFKQLNTEANKSSMFGATALGGRGAQQTNVETIVLITPTILRSDR